MYYYYLFLLKYIDFTMKTAVDAGIGNTKINKNKCMFSILGSVFKPDVHHVLR